MAVDLKYGNVTFENSSSLTLSDEPCFVVRAQDAAAVDTVNAWIEKARTLKADPDTVASALVARNAIYEWQVKNPDLVKVPD